MSNPGTQHSERPQLTPLFVVLPRPTLRSLWLPFFFTARRRGESSDVTVNVAQGVLRRPNADTVHSGHSLLVQCHPLLEPLHRKPPRSPLKVGHHSHNTLDLTWDSHRLPLN